MIVLGIVAVLAVLIFIAGVVVGVVLTFLFLRRRKATSRRREEERVLGFNFPVVDGSMPTRR